MFIAWGDTFVSRASSALERPGNFDSTRMQMYWGKVSPRGSKAVSITSARSAFATRDSR